MIYMFLPLDVPAVRFDSISLLDSRDGSCAITSFRVMTAEEGEGEQETNDLF